MKKDRLQWSKVPTHYAQGFRITSRWERKWMVSEFKFRDNLLEGGYYVDRAEFNTLKEAKAAAQKLFNKSE